MTLRPASKLALAVLVVSALPTSASAQEVEHPRRRAGFMMSARLLVPWGPQTMNDESAVLGVEPVSIPRFVLGAQIADLGVGAGFNFFSREDVTFVLIGPTVSYAVAKSAGGRVQLHVLGSFTFASGSVDGPGDDLDSTAIGFNGGVMGRGLLLDGLGIDVGVGFDFLSVSWEQGDDDETDKGVQIVGFLGGTFVL